MIRDTLLVFGFVAISVPAMAQASSPGIMGGMNPASAIPKPASSGGHQNLPAPAAIPGARSNPSTVAPASRAAADLPPTDALFDAINRGDIAAARDAVSRGADLDGTNVLGLTPLEQSVDLSRNDITFMLLSMRGGGDVSSSASASVAPAAPANLPPTRVASRRRTPHIEVQRSVASEDAVPARPAAVLYSGNGGTPVPSAGFLGFGPQH